MVLILPEHTMTAISRNISPTWQAACPREEEDLACQWDSPMKTSRYPYFFGAAIFSLNAL
jgi:hypothetical protein